MELDLNQMARVRARHRHRNSGGLGYLFTRIRRELEERWRMERDDARVLVVDFPNSDLHPPRAQAHAVSLLGGRTPHIAADQCYHGVIVCLQAAWLSWPEVVAAARRVLHPGGKLLFCTLGPDTLAPLHYAWQQVDTAPHVHPFMDMHHLGDQLLEGGFTDPILDIERVTVAYPDVDTLCADLRAEGFTNLLPERRKTLTGKTRLRAFRDSFRALGESDGAVPVPWELIYGIATAPLPAGAVTVAPPTPRRAVA